MRAYCKLYKHCKIIPEKSFAVDNLTSYLNTLDYINFDNINYFKFDKIDPKLKLELRQELIEMMNSNDYNYIMIQNEGSNTRPYYYFIIDKNWKSENCVELELYLDSANTFTFNTDYVLSNKTKVLREHKDRYKTIEGYRIVLESSYSIVLDSFYEDEEESYWYGIDTLPQNPSLMYLTNYTIEASSSVGVADVSLNNGIITIEVDGGIYENQVALVTYKIIQHFDSKVVKNIDSFPEGINPKLYKGNETEIKQILDTSWYIIYKNRDAINPDEYNQQNPVECFLCADDVIKVASISSASISYSDLTEGKYYYISCSNNGVVFPSTLRFKDNQGHEYELKDMRNTHLSYYLVLYRATGNAYFSVYYYRYFQYTIGGVPIFTTNDIEYTGNNITSLDSLNEISEVRALEMNTNSPQAFDSNYNETFSFTLQTKYLQSINSLDRTDSKLIKVIKLPYCPSEYSIDNQNQIQLDSNWKYDSSSGFFKLNNLNTKFGYSFKVNDVNNPLFNVLNAPSSIEFNSDTLTKDISREPKLLNSEFYYPKFIYDSFGKTFDLEAFDPSDFNYPSLDKRLEVYFKVTSTINSKFLFMFPQYITQEYKIDEDYEAILPIARNNEVVLYNSQYINYLRTGYNYDLKNKNRTEITSGITTGLGIVGAIASMGLGLASGNPAVAVGGILGGITTTTSSIVSNVNTIASAESNLASKIEQLKNQSASVSGADDIDLLDAYSNNRAKLTEYRVSDRMREALYNLFFYCGYATNEFKIPSINTRLWFNFIQAELEINESANLPDFVVKDLVNRFKNGITFLHMNKINNVNTWDFSQNYENWEVSLRS